MEELDKEFRCSLLQHVQDLVHDQHESQLSQQTFNVVCALQCRYIHSQRWLHLTDSCFGLACISSDAEAIKHCKPHFTGLHSRFGHCLRLSENRWKHAVFSQVSLPHYCHRWCSHLFEKQIFFLTEAITGYKIFHITADITDLKQLLLRHCNLLPLFCSAPFLEHTLFLHFVFSSSIQNQQQAGTHTEISGSYLTIFSSRKVHMPLLNVLQMSLY